MAVAPYHAPERLYGVSGHHACGRPDWEGTAAVERSPPKHSWRFPDGVIDLILTDPPYFDNLSYSELSDFYLAWHQVLGIAEPPYHPTAVAPSRATWHSRTALPPPWQATARSCNGF